MNFGAVLPACETGSDPRSLRDWERRGAVLDDQITVTRALWDNDVISVS